MYPKVWLFCQMSQLQHDLCIIKDIPEWEVKCHGINSIFMTLESVEEISRLSIPNFASSIIAARNELIAVLVEAAIG